MLQISDLVGKPFKEGAMGPREVFVLGLGAGGIPARGDRAAGLSARDRIGPAALYENRGKWVQCSGEIPVPALIVFTTTGLCDHVGVYLGLGRFIHAHETAGVVITQTDHIFWKKRIEGYYRPGNL